MLSCPAEPYLTDKLLPNLSMKIIQKKSSRSSADSPLLLHAKDCSLNDLDPVIAQDVPSPSFMRKSLRIDWDHFPLALRSRLLTEWCHSIWSTGSLLLARHTRQECLKHGVLRRSLGLHSCQRSKPNGPSPRHLLLHLLHNGDFK